jgi:Uma2 family endonuclease
MALHATITTWTEQEYLDWEVRNKIRHEYVDGHIFALSGTTKRHNRIAGNLYSLICAHLHGTTCQAYISDVKLKIPSKRTYYYPDVVVGCDPTDAESDYYLTRPCLIIEVLSGSTKQVDKREKLLAYQTLDSLREYVLVNQYQPYVEIYWRDEQGQWQKDTYWRQDHDKILLRCLDLPISLAEVYEGITTLRLVSPTPAAKL